MWAIILVAVLMGAFVALRWWYGEGRDKYRFIKPPFPLPKREIGADKFLRRDEKSAVWRLTALEPQPASDMRCTAFTWREILETLFPARAAELPEINEFFKQIADMDDSSADPYSYGTDSIGAVKWAKRKGFFRSYFNFENTDQMKQFIRDYAPIGAGFILPTQIGIDQVTDPERNMIRGRVNFVSGDAGPRHAIVFFGYDDEVVCNDGSRGAFHVRWHWADNGWCDGEGLLPYSLCGGRIMDVATYGFIIK